MTQIIFCSQQISNYSAKRKGSKLTVGVLLKFIISVWGDPCDYWPRAPRYLTTPLRGRFTRNLICASELPLRRYPPCQWYSNSLNICRSWVTKSEFSWNSLTAALFPQIAVNVGVCFVADFLVVCLNRICFANGIDSDTANTIETF